MTRQATSSAESSLTHYVGDTNVWPILKAASPDFPFARIEAEVRRTIASVLPGWPMGYERYLLERGVPKLLLGQQPLIDSRAERIVFRDSTDIAHLLSRPPIELAAYRLWELIDAGNLTPETLHQISNLFGVPGGVRRHRATTTRFASGETIEFLEPQHVPERLAELLSRVVAQTSDLPPLACAIGVYFETLVIHPLSDGNGRLARLLFMGALHSSLGLTSPIYPLGPALAVNRRSAILAYLSWQFDRNPLPLLCFVEAAIRAYNIEVQSASRLHPQDLRASPGDYSSKNEELIILLEGGP